MTARKLPGIRPWKGQLQAYVRVRGTRYSKSFPKGTAPDVLTRWQTTQRRLHGGATVPGGSFAADIQTYLARVSAMPTYHQRAAHLELWAQELGRDRARHSITTAEIDAVMQRWLTTPSTPAKGRPSGPEGIAPATVRKRRISLLALFHKLDGKDAPNPVRASSAPRAPKPEARGLDYATIATILQAMPESLAKRRATVIAYTGLPPGMLARVQRSDLHLAAATLRVAARRKGAGVAARTIPLSPLAVDAFRAFDDAKAYGAFTVQNVNLSFQRACRKVDVHGVTLYDLRHAFGAQLYRVTHDLATVGRFLLHANLVTTARYAEAANQDVDVQAVQRFAQAVGGGQKVPPKGVRRRKRKIIKHLQRVR